MRGIYGAFDFSQSLNDAWQLFHEDQAAADRSDLLFLFRWLVLTRRCQEGELA
jgi:hypothetical protein